MVRRPAVPDTTATPARSSAAVRDSAAAFAALIRACFGSTRTGAGGTTASSRLRPTRTVASGAASGRRVVVGGGGGQPGVDVASLAVGCWCWCGGERASTRSLHGCGRDVGGTFVVVADTGNLALVSY